MHLFSQLCIFLFQNYSTLLMGKSPRVSRANETEDSTMYLDYPPTKPFINDEYERPPYKPVSSYPEGNRKGRSRNMLLYFLVGFFTFNKRDVASMHLS